MVDGITPEETKALSDYLQDSRSGTLVALLRTDRLGRYPEESS
jgi:hypothetical protein